MKPKDPPILSFAAAILLTLAACVSDKVDLPAAPVPVSSSLQPHLEGVPLDERDPAKVAISDFRFAGGLYLTSRETSRLHGLSDVVIVPGAPGPEVLMVSDDGDVVQIGLLLHEERRELAGASDFFLNPITGLDGKPVQGKQWGDAEGLTILPNGDRLISFERSHRIWRYAKGDARAVPVNMPPVAMAENDGMEGLAAAATVANDAYWVGIETGDIWLCRLSVACMQIDGLPKPPVGFRLSSLTTGPEGELVVLFHSYVPAIGSRIELAIVHDPLKAKRVIGGFAMGPNSTTDNFEGVAVYEKPDGDWQLYLLSDDNFSASQRTLLLAFDWTPPK